MSDSFQVKGRVGVVLEAEIDLPDGWDDFSHEEKRGYMAEQISNEAYDIEQDNPLVEEAIETAEDIVNESSE